MPSDQDRVNAEDFREIKETLVAIGAKIDALDEKHNAVAISAAVIEQRLKSGVERMDRMDVNTKAAHDAVNALAVASESLYVQKRVVIAYLAGAALTGGASGAAVVGVIKMLGGQP